MGLDMYLNARRSIYGMGDKELGQQIQDLLPELNGIEGQWRGSAISAVIAEVGYWRKANAIHNWFVKNVQDDTDDCGTYEVPRDKLTELRDLCQRVLDFKHLANELLPTTEGFFFGTTEYDEYYYSSIEHTIKTLDRAISLPDTWYVEYHSSW